MDDLRALKVSLEDEKFRDKFKGIKSIEEGINRAKMMGFNVKEEELKADEELSSDLLEAVAGCGKNKKYQNVNINATVTGDWSSADIETEITQDL